MTYWESIVLGIVQGLTEFLPVSSSGHLVLVGEVMQQAKGAEAASRDLQGVTFEVMVHIGTLLSVLIYFREKFITLLKSVFDSSMKKERMLILYLAIGTIPAVVAVLLFKDFFEDAYARPVQTSALLCVTGLILLLPRMVRVKTEKDVGLGSAIVMGIGQALAILPGISRSGSTITAGMLSGVKPSEAAEFSFLLSVPAIAGAMVFKLDELTSLPASEVGQHMVGLVTAFVFGLFAIYGVLASIRKGKFEYFAIYCLIVGMIGIVYFSSHSPEPVPAAFEAILSPLFSETLLS